MWLSENDSILSWNMKYGMRNVSEFGNQTSRGMLISNYLTVLLEQKYLNFLK
jgi:DNA adenine methylase